MFIANALASVHRATVDNGLGDAIDDFDAPPVSGLEKVPFSLIEKSRRVQDPASGMWRTVRYIAGRTFATKDVRPADLVKTTSGNVYVVDETNLGEPSIGATHDLDLELRVL